jgi:hypothetical protein
MKTAIVAFYLSLFPFAFVYSQSETDSTCNLSPITALPILTGYTNFTPERQSALEKMGDFFEETVLDNFPAETDTASYEAFLKCLIHNGGLTDIPYVIQVDRKKLAKINA